MRAPRLTKHVPDDVQRDVGGLERDLLEQLELKTLLLDALAHDVRGSLTVISGMASTMRGPQAPLLSEEERELWLSRIVSNAERIEAILTNLLDLERASSGDLQVHRTPTDAVALVRNVITELDPHGHPIEVPEGEVVVSINPFLVERIVENLLTNAVRHTPRGTAVRVGITASPSALELAVDDDGPGVTANMQEAVFNRFSTDGADNPGVGLGLSLVKRLAKLHGGDAWLADGSSGASFHVLLSTDGAAGTLPASGVVWEPG